MLRYTQQLTKSKCYYGLIEKSHWVQPDWIDEDKATKAREEMIAKKGEYCPICLVVSRSGWRLTDLDRQCSHLWPLCPLPQHVSRFCPSTL